MNSTLRGLYAGLTAGLIVALLYFVDYGPGYRLNTLVAHWFALDNRNTGRFTGFVILIVLGAIFGLIFGILQRKGDTTFIRTVLTGLALGIAWWVVFALIIASVVGHMSLTFDVVLFSLMLCLVYGLLLGTVYFQMRENRV